jgi:hypothetical protein
MGIDSLMTDDYAHALIDLLKDAREALLDGHSHCGIEDCSTAEVIARINLTLALFEHHHGPPIYVIHDGSVRNALNVADPKRWDCPCECGGYVLYGWRKVGDHHKDEIAEWGAAMRRDGGTKPVDNEQVVLCAVPSRSFYDDGTLRLIGFETVDEIGTPTSFAFLPELDRNLLAIWFAVGLSDALRREMVG